MDTSVEVNVTKWLKSGPQTEITNDIRRKVRSIKGSGVGWLINALIWLRGNVRLKETKDSHLFRKRTADEII